MSRWLTAVAVALVATGAAAGAWWAARPGARPDVVLIVLDTVRADHTSVCGYARPTTPVLEGLRDEGWVTACDVVAPGPWTVPSHLSFFTGLSYVDFRTSGAELPTLAERFAADGYDTAFLSANMILKKRDVFRRGFRQTQVARGYNELKGARFGEALAALLAALDPEKPAFLVLNLVDAHSPYRPVPRGVEWLPAQGPVKHEQFKEDSDVRRFEDGAMAPADAEAFERRLVNGYDWGIATADQGVGEVLRLLGAAGRLEHARVVITSDHGELLGEHDRVGHGETLYEPGMRVPLLFHATDGPAPTFPPAMSGLEVFHLVREGRLSEERPLPTATTYASLGDRSSNAVAIWAEDGSKLVWDDGEAYRVDLRADPGEQGKAPIGDHPARATLDALVEQNGRVIELDRAARGGAGDDTELLRAAGYVE